MARRIFTGIALIAIALIIASCGSAAKIKATWIKPNISGDAVSIPLSEVQNDTIVHFSVPTSAGPIAFMSYELGDSTYLRSNICPPCRSIGFSLQEDILVCDTCGTTFQAKTGNGIAGPCVNYPKAAVKYTVNSGNIVTDADALYAAYQNTMKPGLP